MPCAVQGEMLTPQEEAEPRDAGQQVGVATGCPGQWPTPCWRPQSVDSSSSQPAGSATHRLDVRAAIDVGAPAADTLEAEGVVAVQQAELALGGVRVVHDAVQADAALHVPAGLPGRDPLRSGRAVCHVLLPLMLVRGVQRMSSACLHTHTAHKASEAGQRGNDAYATACC